MIGQTQKFPEWRVIVDLFRAAAYGDVLTHETIATATHLRPETLPYYRQMAQARRALLRDHDIEVECLAKVGYKRVEPERYGERARRDTRLGTRRIKRGARVVKAAPLHLLTAEQVKELEHTMLLLAALKTQASQVLRSMKNILPPVQAPKQLASAADGADTTRVQ
jgi:hypothetical protein